VTDAARRAALPLLLIAVPVVGYLLLIAAYGVNTIVLDQWADIAFLQKVYSGHAGFAAFWAPHNENRILVPDLIVLSLAYLTHFNTVVEMYISAAFLLLATTVIVFAYRRRAAPAYRNLVWYFPVVALLWTLAQYYSALLGFQLAWYLALALTALALAVLDRLTVGWAAVVLAVLLGTLASYSTLAGLLVWPAGLALMLLRRRPWPYPLIWLASAMVVSVLYLRDLTLGLPGTWSWDLHNPLLVLRFVLVALGDVLGYSIPPTGDFTTVVLVAMMGAVVLLLSLVALASAVRLRGEPGPAPFGAALVVVGLGFAFITALGRSVLGVFVASGSRYVTYDVLAIVGSYLVLLAAVPADAAAATVTSRHRAFPAPRRGMATTVAVTAILAIVAVGVYNGIEGGHSTQAYDNAASDVVVNVNKAPGDLVEADVYPLVNPAYVRSLVPFVRAHHLSLFNTSVATIDRRLGLYARLTIKL
jgi:hypothetical protein